MKLLTKIAALLSRRKSDARPKPRSAPPRCYGVEITRIECPIPGGIPVLDAFPPKA
jgi:hypothetical protein